MNDEQKKIRHILPRYSVATFQKHFKEIERREWNTDSTTLVESLSYISFVPPFFIYFIYGEDAGVEAFMIAVGIILLAGVPKRIQTNTKAKIELRCDKCECSLSGHDIQRLEHNIKHADGVMNPKYFFPDKSSDTGYSACSVEHYNSVAHIVDPEIFYEEAVLVDWKIYTPTWCADCDPTVR